MPFVSLHLDKDFSRSAGLHPCILILYNHSVLALRSHHCNVDVNVPPGSLVSLCRQGSVSGLGSQRCAAGLQNAAGWIRNEARGDDWESSLIHLIYHGYSFLVEAAGMIWHDIKECTSKLCWFQAWECTTRTCDYHVPSDLSRYRIVQRAIETADRAMSNLEQHRGIESLWLSGC